MRHTFLFFILALGLGTPAHALVDMRLANYSDTWTDLEIPGTGYDLKVVRTYNSRSLFNGIFGFGWCSDFETQFVVTPDNTIKLRECGDGLEVLYSPKGFSRKATSRVVDKIVAKVKKATPNARKQYFKDLKAQLMLDVNMRQKYAEQYKVTAKTKVGTVYYANNQSVESIRRKKGYYERVLPNGTKQRFDLSGRMTHLYDKNSNYLKLSYKGRNLKRIQDNMGRQLAFRYHTNGKVKSIAGPNGLKVSYKFARLNDLVQVKSAWGNTYKFDYDDLHNLVRVDYPDKSHKVISYNTNKDWVTSFQGRDKCIESYKYDFDKADKKNHYWANVTKTCKGKVDTKAKFEFWYKARKKLAGKFLKRARTEINKNVTDIVYSEEFGRPLKNTVNGLTTHFVYYKNGLLKTRKTGREIASFKYNRQFNKVSEVKIGKNKTFFNYDKKGNLTAAKSTLGQSVKLTYDNQGRIVSLTDQAKRRVNIKYDSRFGKPAIVSRPGVGKIKVSYKKNGEIKKVDSKDGPTVAVQIASTFNSLLDIVSPAGIDLGL